MDRGPFVFLAIFALKKSAVPLFGSPGSRTFNAKSAKTSQRAQRNLPRALRGSDREPPPPVAAEMTRLRELVTDASISCVARSFASPLTESVVKRLPSRNSPPVPPARSENQPKGTAQSAAADGYSVQKPH